MRPSITDPMGPAWARMKHILFQPFDLGKWFCIGFAAWLMTLTEGGGSFQSPPYSASEDSDILSGFFAEYMALILSLIGILICLGIALLVLLVWLSCRGRFVFLDQVIHNRTLIKQPWRETREIGHSLFFWSLGLLVASIVVIAAPAIGGVLFLLPAFTGESVDSGALLLGIASFGLAGVLAIPMMYIWFYLNEFIAPIMYRYRCTTGNAWRFFSPMFKAHTGSLVVYPLFRALLSTGVGIAVLILGVLTCCIGFLLIMIPYIGAVALLPLTVFFTSYSLEYLKSLGPDFDVFCHVETTDAPSPPDSGLAIEG